MAITIEDAPATWSPVYNPMVFVMSSTNTGQTNFRYIYDIYYTSPFTTVDIRIKVSPTPSGSYGVLDVSKVLQSLITKDIGTSDYGFETCPNSFREFQIHIGEEYEVAGVLTEFPDLVTSSSFYAYSAWFDPHTFLSFDYTDYALSTSTPGQFLTNAAQSTPVAAGQSAWLYYLQTVANRSKAMVIKTYNSAGTLLNTFRINNSSASTLGIHRFGCGPSQLNVIPGGDFLLGAQPIIDGNVATYTLNTANITTFAATSQVYTFAIEQTSCKYDNWRLVWQNPHGGYDAFNFKLKSKKFLDVERKQQKNSLGTVTAGSWGYTKMDRMVTDFTISVKERYTVTTDLLTDAQMQWLKELLYSSDVYYEDSSNNLIPINISDTSIEEKKKQNEKVYNLEISFVKSVMRNR